MKKELVFMIIKHKILTVMMIGCLLVGIESMAQTPADDPGIGGPGIGAAPAGDGSPIVPFDGGMSLILLASGISYGSKKLRKK